MIDIFSYILYVDMDIPKPLFTTQLMTSTINSDQEV